MSYSRPDKPTFTKHTTPHNSRDLSVLGSATARPNINLLAIQAAFAHFEQVWNQLPHSLPALGTAHQRLKDAITGA